jgi:hypothetical protein
LSAAKVVDPERLAPSIRVPIQKAKFEGTKLIGIALLVQLGSFGLDAGPRISFLKSRNGKWR